MIYFKICKVIKNDFNGTLKGNVSDLTAILESETIAIIKIGYTDDKEVSIKARDSNYRTENPNIIHYKYIKGGDRIDETRIHMKFRNKSFKGIEWFVLDQEIFEFMLRINSIEDLRKEVNNVSLADKLRDTRYKVHHEEYVINSVIKVLYPDIEVCIFNKNYENLYSKFCRELWWIRNEELENYLVTQYRINIDKFREVLSINKPKVNNISDKVKELASKINSLVTSIDKLKEIVKIGKDLTEKDMEDLFSLLPPKYRDYYVLLGPDRIKANSYQESKLRKEWIKLHSEVKIEDGMISKIYSSFSKGERYTNSDIKDKLKEIYSEFGYSKTAKASDLEAYFYMKKVYITSIKKNGFEIIGKK